MKKAACFAVGFAMALLSGCQTAFWSSDYGKDKSVTVFQGSVLTKNSLKDASVDYNGVKVSLAAWSTAGDTDMALAIAKGIAYVGSVYYSGGAAPAIGSILQAMYAPAATNNVEAVK
jgi:hypothetical protein